MFATSGARDPWDRGDQMPRNREHPNRGHSRRRKAMGLVVSLTFAACLASFGCSEEPSTPAPRAESAPAPPSAPASPAQAAQPEVSKDPAALTQEGRSVYMANCIACHNPNPTADGALGPAVKGSSRQLLYARVVKGEYPEGYTPKRQTAVMVALPHLEPKIDALAAYLADQP